MPITAFPTKWTPTFDSCECCKWFITSVSLGGISFARIDKWPNMCWLLAHCALSRTRTRYRSVFSSNLMHLLRSKWFLIDLFSICNINAPAHCLFWQLSGYRRYRHVWKKPIFPNATHLLSPFANGLTVSSQSPLRWFRRGGKRHFWRHPYGLRAIVICCFKKMPSVGLGATKSISIIRSIGPRTTMKLYLYAQRSSNQRQEAMNKLNYI